MLLRLRTEPAAVAPPSIELGQTQVCTPWGSFSMAHHGGMALALQAALRQPLNAKRLEVTVSDLWARYRLLPWRADLISEQAWQAYARQCFEQANMPLGQDWTLHLCPANFGAPRLVVALSAQVDAALRQCPVSVHWTTPFLNALSTLDEGILAAYDAGRMNWARIRARALEQVLSLRFNVECAEQHMAQQYGVFAGQSARKVTYFASGEAHERLRQAGVEVHAYPPLSRRALMRIDRPMPPRARWAKMALALLAPLGLAMLLLGQRGDSSDARLRDAPGTALPAVFSQGARQQAHDLEAQLTQPWRPLLHTLEAQWPDNFVAKQLSVDAAQGELSLQGTAPNIAALQRLLNELTQGGHRVQLRQITATSSSAAPQDAIDFEVAIVWTR